jgi:hypothetical protein
MEISSFDLFQSTSRADLYVKLLYFLNVLKHNSPHKNHYEEIYIKHILARTNGKEPKDPFNKNNWCKKTIKDYLQKNKLLYKSMINKGFDPNYPIVLTENKKVLLSGAHRLSCSKLLNIVPSILYKKGKRKPWSFNDLQKCLTAEEYETVLYRYCLENNNTCILLFGDFKFKDITKEVECKVLYEKEITLDETLLKDIYALTFKNFNIITTIKNKFHILQQNQFLTSKLVILDKDYIPILKKKKNLIRESWCNQTSIKYEDFITLHTPTSLLENEILLNLAFNLNYKHFIKHQQKTSLNHKKLNNLLLNLHTVLSKHQIPHNQAVIVGSSVLDIYNVRETTDLDIVILDRHKYQSQPIKLELDYDIVSLGYINPTIVNNESFYFYHKGFKFLNINTILSIKQRLKRKKDLNDINLYQQLYE